MLSDFPFSELNSWYLKYGRHTLPWRDYSFDNKTLGYRVWLAETMLQQTQVERVKSYFHNILEAFPTIDDLASTNYEEFFPYYKWLGYYSRARNMLKTAKLIVEEFDSVFPEDTTKLKTLPGVGPYTAEAIRAFAYNKATLSFDTNLEKIFSRYYFGNKYKKLTQEEKKHILADFISSWMSSRDINNALMDYGATISLNNISWISWDNYPLKSSQFYKTRWTLEPIKEKKKSNFPSKQAYVIAILHENHKTYFSSTQSFSPFFIWKNTLNPRALTQEYFFKNYGLEVSVRPPEIKSYNNKDIPYMLCYVQIQSWRHNFKVFKWLKLRGFEEGFIEKMAFWE